MHKLQTFGIIKDHPEIIQTIRKLSRLSGNFPDHLETSWCNFKGYAQKLSGRAKTFGWQCHDATMVFVPLEGSFTIFAQSTRYDALADVVFHMELSRMRHCEKSN